MTYHDFGRVPQFSAIAVTPLCITAVKISLLYIISVFEQLLMYTTKLRQRKCTILL